MRGRGVGGGGVEGDTARHEAVGSSPLRLHALRARTKHARSALSGDPKHHAARLEATSREASQRMVKLYSATLS